MKKRWGVTATGSGEEWWGEVGGHPRVPAESGCCQEHWETSIWGNPVNYWLHTRDHEEPALTRGEPGSWTNLTKTSCRTVLRALVVFMVVVNYLKGTGTAEWNIYPSLGLTQKLRNNGFIRNASDAAVQPFHNHLVSFCTHQAPFHGYLATTWTL